LNVVVGCMEMICACLCLVERVVHVPTGEKPANLAQASDPRLSESSGVSPWISSWVAA